MWQVYKEAGRPWPVICAEDDVLDYMVMEAVALKARKAAKEAQRQVEIAEFKERSKKELLEMVG